MANQQDIFKTPEILDVTEVEKTKILQTEETKRKEILEKEISYRKSEEKWQDSNFLWVVGIAVVSIAGTILGVSMFYIDRAYNHIPQCEESSHIYASGESRNHSCSAGASLQTSPIPGSNNVEVKCICTK